MACLCELTHCLYHPKKQLIIKHYFFVAEDVGLNLEKKGLFYFTVIIRVFEAVFTWSAIDDFWHKLSVCILKTV